MTGSIKSYFGYTIKIILAFFVILTIYLYLFINLPSSFESYLYINKGDSVKAITNNIIDIRTFAIKSHSINSKLLHTILALVSKNTAIHNGKYEIKKQSTILDLIYNLSERNTVKSFVLLYEGITAYQAKNTILAHEYFHNKEFTTDFKESEVFPDTYRVEYGMDPDEVVVMMKNQMEKIKNKYSDHELDSSIFKSFEDVLTLASIVEVESQKQEEANKIASLYINRLKINMPLQSDPTVLYAITNNMYARYNRRIYHKDLRYNSKYNTYLNKGLPPSAICLVSENSIKAVLKPVQSNYLYMVANRKGGHMFAENMAQHLKNVKTFNEIRNLDSSPKSN